MTSLSTTWSTSNRTSDTLEVYLLGIVDFDSVLFLQERLVYEISGRSDKLGGLLICEHPPMVTIGRDGSQTDLLADPGEFVARQMEVRWTNRGGACLVHAPGQLAVYPVVPLDRLGFGLANYRSRLEQAVIDMCRELQIPAHRNPNEPGVFCRCGQTAALGVAVRSWVAYHGLFVNVCPNLDLVRMVRSNRCGERTTSLSAQRLRKTSMHAVRESIIRNLVASLGYETYHFYTGHPLLRRTRRRVYDYA